MGWWGWCVPRWSCCGASSAAACSSVHLVATVCSSTWGPCPCCAAAQVTGCERRIVQLQHEMKRKEREFERLQEK